MPRRYPRDAPRRRQEPPRRRAVPWQRAGRRPPSRGRPRFCGLLAGGPGRPAGRIRAIWPGRPPGAVPVRDQVQQPQARSPVERRVMGVEDQAVPPGAAGEQQPERRRAVQRGRAGQEARPGHVQVRLGLPARRRHRVGTGLRRELPGVGAAPPAAAGPPGPGSRLAGQHRRDRVPQPVRVEVAGQPDLQVNVVGFGRRVEVAVQFVHDAERTVVSRRRGAPDGRPGSGAYRHLAHLTIDTRFRAAPSAGSSAAHRTSPVVPCMMTALVVSAYRVLLASSGTAC